MTDSEEWRPIVGYEGYYEVSNLGNVRGIDRVVERSDGIKTRLKGQPMKPFIRDGYPGVRLTVNAASKSLNVHRLVALAFLGPPQPGQEVCHNDGNRGNPVASNLRWGTRAENQADARAHGTYVNPNAIKLYCKRDHPLFGDNVRIDSRTGIRYCRACGRFRYHRMMRRRSGLK